MNSQHTATHVKTRSPPDTLSLSGDIEGGYTVGHILLF